MLFTEHLGWSSLEGELFVELRKSLCISWY